MWGRRSCGYGGRRSITAWFDDPAQLTRDVTPSTDELYCANPLTTGIEYYQGNCIDVGSGRKALKGVERGALWIVSTPFSPHRSIEVLTDALDNSESTLQVALQRLDLCNISREVPTVDPWMRRDRAPWSSRHPSRSRLHSTARTQLAQGPAGVGKPHTPQGHLWLRLRAMEANHRPARRRLCMTVPPRCGTWRSSSVVTCSAAPSCIVSGTRHVLAFVPPGFHPISLRSAAPVQHQSSR